MIFDFHPTRFYFQYLLYEHLSGVTNHLGNNVKPTKEMPYPRIKKGAKQYVQRINQYWLIGRTKLLNEQLSKVKHYPKSLRVKYSNIPKQCFEIMYKPQVQELIEIGALRGLSIKELTDIVNEVGKSQFHFTEIDIHKYLHFFWNVLPNEGWNQFKQNKLIEYLSHDRSLKQVYADYIDVARGNLSVFEQTVKYGSVHEVSDQIGDEIYRGFAMNVIRRNTATLNNQIEEADTYSKIMARDSQVLRNLGFKPRKEALREAVKVVYDDSE